MNIKLSEFFYVQAIDRIFNENGEEINLGEYSVIVKCPHCTKNVETKTERKAGSLVYAMMLVLCYLLLFP